LILLVSIHAGHDQTLGRARVVSARLVFRRGRRRPLRDDRAAELVGVARDDERDAVRLRFAIGRTANTVAVARGVGLTRADRIEARRICGLLVGLPHTTAITGSYVPRILIALIDAVRNPIGIGACVRGAATSNARLRLARIIRAIIHAIPGAIGIGIVSRPTQAAITLQILGVLLELGDSDQIAAQLNHRATLGLVRSCRADDRVWVSVVYYRVGIELHAFTREEAGMRRRHGADRHGCVGRYDGAPVVGLDEQLRGTGIADEQIGSRAIQGRECGSEGDHLADIDQHRALRLIQPNLGVGIQREAVDEIGAAAQRELGRLVVERLERDGAVVAGNDRGFFGRFEDHVSGYRARERHRPRQRRDRIEHGGAIDLGLVHDHAISERQCFGVNVAIDPHSIAQISRAAAPKIVEDSARFYPRAATCAHCHDGCIRVHFRRGSDDERSCALQNGCEGRHPGGCAQREGNWRGQRELPLFHGRGLISRAGNEHETSNDSAPSGAEQRLGESFPRIRHDDRARELALRAAE